MATARRTTLRAPPACAVALLLASCTAEPPTSGVVADLPDPVVDTAVEPLQPHTMVDPGSIRRIFLVTLDTLRADRIEAERMPFLSSLEAESVVWTGAWGQSWTYAGVGTILTGRHPATWGRDSYLDGGGVPPTLSPDVGTVAEALGERGWASAYWTSNMVGIETQLNRGYDATETMGLGGVLWHEGIPTWIQANEGQRQLIHIHMNDAHDPYSQWSESCAPEQEVLPFSECRYELVHATGDGVSQAARDMLTGAFSETSEDFATCQSLVTSLYDCEVLALDQALQALFDRLELSGYLQDALVVISPDHGEGLFDPYPNHGIDQRAPVTRSRVLFWSPGRLAPEVVTTTLGQDDILPTVEALLGVRTGLAGTGTPYWEVEPERVVTGYHFVRTMEQGAVEVHYAVNDRYHYIVASDGDARLYDHLADPGETTDLIDTMEVPAALIDAVASNRLLTAGYAAE